MNKYSRKQLQDANEMLDKALSLLQDARDIIEDVSGEERDKFDNATEGLQATERFQAMEENADTMDELVDTIDGIIGEIEDAMSDETFEL